MRVRNMREQLLQIDSSPLEDDSPTAHSSNSLTCGSLVNGTEISTRRSIASVQTKLKSTLFIHLTPPDNANFVANRYRGVSIERASERET
jgi:hypothetical protein